MIHLECHFDMCSFERDLPEIIKLNYLSYTHLMIYLSLNFADV